MQTRVIAANGLEFATDLAGEGDTVALLLHGFPESRATWRRQLETLPSLGWTIAAPDMRGYGETSRPAGRAAYRIERLVEDVGALFDALGARRRILVGHDWGGVIAWQAALAGMPLDGLVILNAPHPMIFRRALQGWDQRRRSWYVLFFLLPVLPEWQLKWGSGQGLTRILAGQSPNFPPDLLETYRRNVMAPGAATAMLNYYRANALALSDAKAKGAPLPTPTLMIWGDKDVALGPALTEGNEALVADFTLRRAADASHWIQQDAPDLINSAIADWARARGLASGAPGA